MDHVGLEAQQQQHQPGRGDSEPGAVDRPRLAGLQLGTSARVVTQECRQRAQQPSEIAATDLADFLVKRGTPFREAHGVCAGLVRTAVDEGRSLREVTVAELGEEAGGIFEQSAWLESKVSEGGTALPRVREQLAAARGLLEPLG